MRKYNFHFPFSIFNSYDGVECAEGICPNASTNYCCNISVTYTDIFQTTNALTFVARWGDTEVSAPAVVTTKTLTHDFGHCVATRGEIVYNQLGKTEETNYVSSVRKQIRAATVDGLSGSPVFLVVNNQLVFLFSKHMGYRDRLTWAPNWGPMISYHLDTIQSVIDSWEGGRASQYQLSILPMGELNQIRVDTFGGNE